jgi:4-amino-4-deoxychorismate lyase
MNSLPQVDFLINGQNQVGLSVMDRALAYGDGVFRTLKIQQGKPQHWDLHCQKLAQDCAALKLACPDAALLLQDIAQLFAYDESAVAKIIISRGIGLRGYALPAEATSTRIVIKSALPQYAEINALEGVKLHVCELTLGYQPLLAGIKHLNRLENVLARMEWSAADIADGLLLDAERSVIECTMSNIFVREGKNLLTPDLSRCGVAGITRQRIINIAPKLGLAAKITAISLPQLLEAEDVFICNSLFGIWQVRQIGEHLLQKTTWVNTLREALV